MRTRFAPITVELIFITAAFQCRQYFGTPEAARILGPEYVPPAWLSC